ncbi:hypothetical protein HanRHA438_Chr14g0640811 [Helianthus annuus]|nr:hypothetical protein HanRHA438_Chr14g0640811 [Helianthus annuus]
MQPTRMHTIIVGQKPIITMTARVHIYIIRFFVTISMMLCAILVRYLCNVNVEWVIYVHRTDHCW